MEYNETLRNSCQACQLHKNAVHNFFFLNTCEARLHRLAIFVYVEHGLDHAKSRKCRQERD